MNLPTEYPLPRYAAYVWTDNTKIILTFPGYKGLEDRRFNSVLLEPQVKQTCVCKKCGTSNEVVNPSMEILWTVLKERANTTDAHQRVISSKATPTQYNIDEMYKTMKITRIEKKEDVSKKSADEILSGLDDAINQALKDLCK